MSQPSLWITFAVLFVVVGLLNIARGRRQTGGAGAARMALGAACFVWAAAAAAYRFVSLPAGYALAGLAAAVMVGAAVRGMRRRGD